MDKQIFEQMHRLEERHWWFVARRKIIARAIRCIGFSKDIKILDAGCGNGDNLSLWFIVAGCRAEKMMLIFA